MSEEAWYWLRSAEEAWLPAKLVSSGRQGNVFVVRGSQQVYSDADVGPRIEHPAGLSEDFDDMVKMEDVNEATILHNLKLRFSTSRIYTGIGDVLVSLNPFQALPIYGAADVDRYFSLRAGGEAPPHVFMVANNAYKGLTEMSHDQSIIISGESGAGKTEATKKCLAFLADVAGASPASAGLDRRLLAANPILEAFGNAKTVRNNNSSRFGERARCAAGMHRRVTASCLALPRQVDGDPLQWQGADQWLSHRHLPAGEEPRHRAGEAKTRADVVWPQAPSTRLLLCPPCTMPRQAPEERSYHIFYQMCAALDDATRAELCVSRDAADHRYLSTSGCVASACARRRAAPAPA